MLKIVLLAAALTAAQTSAYAFEIRDTKVEIFVSTRGVNFGAPSEVVTLHRELERKATLACDSGAPRMLAVASSDQTCAKQALDRAVAKIGQPMLTAVHQGRPVNAQLAQR
jgi:UrcA family protein